MYYLYSIPMENAQNIRPHCLLFIEYPPPQKKFDCNTPPPSKMHAPQIR